MLGGAGSGKTTVLARRFAWLVAHEHVAPESILVLTPSAASASGLRRAVEDTLDRPYEELAIHTVRELCARLLREETAEAGVDPFFAPVTRADRLALLLDRIDDLHLRSHDIGGRPAVLLADVIDRIDRLKDGLVTAAEYAAWAHALPADDDAERARAAREVEFAQLYLDHDRLLAAVGALDAGELVLRAVALLRSPHVRARVACATATCSSTSTPTSASRRRCSSSCSVRSTTSSRSSPTTTARHGGCARRRRRT